MINPENDELCASIISNVIARGEGKSRIASSPTPIIRNEVFALRQKLFGNFPIAESTLVSQNWSLSPLLLQENKSPNQAYKLKILFGLSSLIGIYRPN